MNRRLRRRVKSFVEESFGMTISRTAAMPSKGHADAALRQLRRWSPRDVVFDVGANDGRTILRIGEALSNPQILAFEPVASTYQTLVRRTSHLPNVRAFQVALGAACSRESMYLNEIDAMNSLSPRWTEAPAGIEDVEVTTVDRVMAEQRIEFIHFLKIDTEGYELEVLKGAEGALRSSRVGIIQVEVGVDQAGRDFLSLERARRHLAERQYFLQGVYNQCLTPARPPDAWPAEEVAGFRSRVLAYCDALFIRANL